MVFKGVIVSTTGQYLAIFCRKTSKQTRSSCLQMPVRSLFERSNFAICKQAVRVKQFKCHLFDQVLSSLKVNGKQN